jgi:cysteine-rich repeat protein
MVQRVIDTTLASLPVPLDEFAPDSAQAMIALRQLLDNYTVSGGTGVSLINFFTVPGVADQFVARDIILLQMLHAALDLCASDALAPAFGNSTDLADYRWGYLHRIVLDHPLGGALSIPPTGSPQNVAPDLPGFARAGGMGSVDAASHSARADGLNEFMFGSGPSRRVIATMTPDGPEVLEVIPGGESGAPGSPYQVDQLALWLVNAYKPLPVSLEDVNAAAVDTETYACGDGATGPGEECDDGNSNNADGCNDACRISPLITCNAPTVPADAQTCDASIVCSAVASCVDPAGGNVTSTCDSGGPFGLGTSNVTVQCSDGEDSAVVVCPVTVVDEAPPTISVDVSPDMLWPPNHRMVDIAATVTAADTCGATTVVLTDVASDEPDNAVGNGDGNTDNDIQEADLGTSDFALLLRAERDGSGDGRTYTVTYTATDAAGNETSGAAVVEVPHDQGGVTDPLEIVLAENSSGTVVSWNPVVDAIRYNVVRTTKAEFADTGAAYSLGALTCIEAWSNNETTHGHEDSAIPASGELFLYFVEYVDTARSSYGSESAAKPRTVKEGDCE